MSLRSLALSTLLLGADVLGAAIEKRGFRVPARKWYPKHVLEARAEGAVVAYYDGGWIIPVLIGGQEVILNVDTGSSDLWTASTALPQSVQQTITSGTIYDPSSSSTFQNMTGFSYGLYYADGSGSAGYVGTDTVNIGGATVPNMPFGVCDKLIYGSGESSRDTDGPVGLGFGAENSIQPNPQCTFMECLEPYVPDPVFATAFQQDDNGFIDFGFVNSSAYTGQLTEIPIANTSSGNEGQWVALNVQFGSGGNVFSSAPITMDFDTGTSSLSLPADAAADYFALVPGSDNSTGSWTYPCSETLPDFDFVFSQVNRGPSTITVPGSSLENGGDGQTCNTWIYVVTGRANAGHPFYISQYMIWYQPGPTLSFAELSI